MGILFFWVSYVIVVVIPTIFLFNFFNRKNKKTVGERVQPLLRENDTDAIMENTPKEKPKKPIKKERFNRESFFWTRLDKEIEHLSLDADWKPKDANSQYVKSNVFQFTIAKSPDDDSYVKFQCKAYGKEIFRLTYSLGEGIIYDKLREDYRASLADYRKLYPNLIKVLYSYSSNNPISQNLQINEKSERYKKVNGPSTTSIPLFVFMFTAENEWENFTDINEVDVPNLLVSNGTVKKMWRREIHDYIYYKTCHENGKLLHCMVFNKDKKEYFIAFNELSDETKRNVEQFCIRAVENETSLDVFQQNENEQEKEDAFIPLFQSLKEELHDVMQYQELMTPEEFHLLTNTFPKDMMNFENTYQRMPLINKEEADEYLKKAEEKMRNSIKEIKGNISKRQLTELKKDTLVILERS